MRDDHFEKLIGALGKSPEDLAFTELIEASEEASEIFLESRINRFYMFKNSGVIIVCDLASNAFSHWLLHGKEVTSAPFAYRGTMLHGIRFGDTLETVTQKLGPYFSHQNSETEFEDYQLIRDDVEFNMAFEKPGLLLMHLSAIYLPNNVESERHVTDTW